MGLSDIPYDGAAPLITDREPFFLIERAKLSISGSCVIASKGTKKINVPIRSIHLLILGNGASLTSEVMYVCAKERCYIAHSRGGLNIHSLYHSGIYSNPDMIFRQIASTKNDHTRIKVARYMVRKKIEQFITYNQKLILDLDLSNTLDSIRGIEGIATKIEYRELYGDIWRRSYSQHGDIVNKNISILNSIFYNFIASIICTLGYSPSIGFLHGHTRRGALVFDIADLFKHKLYLTDKELLYTQDNLVRKFSSKLTQNRKEIVKEIIDEIHKICSGEI